MSAQLPHEVFGLAIFVNALGFIAVFLGLLLCFMLWRHGEGLSYILLLGVSTTLGAVQGVVTHLDYTINWRQIQIERYEAFQKPQRDRTAMFGKSDSGWRSVSAAIGIYLYNVDSLLVLFWAITLFIGTWNIRIKSEKKKTMAIVLKSTAILLPAVMVSLCQIKALRARPVLFLVVVNIIMTVSMVVGFFLVLAILYKYLLARSIFRRFFKRDRSTNGCSSSLGTVSTVASGNRGRTTDKWLIVRFSLIMTVLIAFEAALIVYQLVNLQRNRHSQRPSAEVKGPRLSIEQARVDLFQYIPGVVPSIVAWCIFGTTYVFRREYMAFIRAWCCCLCLPYRHPDSVWRRSSYGRQGSLDAEAPSHQASLPKDGKPSISIEVNTEISLSSMSTHKTLPMNTHRVSFGGTSLLPEQLHQHRNPSTNQIRGPISPISSNSPRFPMRTLSHSTSPRAPNPSLSKETTGHHSFPRSTRTASMDKELPAVPPQAPPTTPPVCSSPAMGISNTPSSLSPPGLSWLSTNMDSKSSSVYSRSEYAPTQSSTSELFPPPLAIGSPR
ncbi:glycoside hydrolase [Diplodia corticola]|uniref:Glycoside hydrolase n=1 Tax=Diplodia corticola TaxID=236234 RepID=A0A1J9R3N0_9PEZI|nr:glycoside hydrolase [Diplodia corticola]OJD35185.1 glycoside hydrolase [Diplodia corticola]